MRGGDGCARALGKKTPKLVRSCFEESPAGIGREGRLGNNASGIDRHSSRLGGGRRLARGGPWTRIPWFYTQSWRSWGLPRRSLRGFAPSTSSGCFPTAKGRLPGVAGQAAEDPRKTHYARKCQPRAGFVLGTVWGHVALINCRCLSRGGTMKSWAGVLCWNDEVLKPLPNCRDTPAASSSGNRLLQQTQCFTPTRLRVTLARARVQILVSRRPQVSHTHREFGHCHVHTGSHERVCSAWRGQPHCALAQSRLSGQVTISTFREGAACLG